MATYTLSPIYEPQYVPFGSGGGLTFASSIGGGFTVPANNRFVIQTCRVANNSGSPVTFEVWRVPGGAAQDNQHIIVPQINIPVATQTDAWFDVGPLWGVVLNFGDTIIMAAGTANALVVQADGAVVVT